MRNDAPVLLCGFCEEGPMAMEWTRLDGTKVTVCLGCLRIMVAEFELQISYTKDT